MNAWFCTAALASRLSSVAAAASRSVGVASIVAAALSAALPVPGSAQPVGTRHDLALAARRSAVDASGVTSEICVFCHTPQGSDESAAVPMWNSARPVAANFTTYDSLGTSSLEGRTAPVGSVSIACLSCHDGVTSMSAVISVPGSGWESEGGLRGTPAIIVRSRAHSAVDSDLRNDHPVGIQYGGGGLKASAPNAVTRDPDFKRPSSAVINGTLVWWVDTESSPNGSRQKTDMILYTRGPGGSYAGQTEPEPFVECASCHDPHSANVTFLRIPSANSAACFACHSK